jgi:hypothetical protein
VGKILHVLKIDKIICKFFGRFQILCIDGIVDPTLAASKALLKAVRIQGMEGQQFNGRSVAESHKAAL